MKFQVSKWKRVWESGKTGVGNYEDVFSPVGSFNFTMSGDSDHRTAKIGTLIVHNVFSVLVTNEYIEIHGFLKPEDKPQEYVQFRMS